ncbi:MAG: imidazole glycerol phosphate synthase subunit HisH [Actinomycetota bacterium]
MTRILVIDHGAGNLVSIGHGLAAAGAEVQTTSNPSDLDRTDGVVLPGVGASGAVMSRLIDTGFVEPLRNLGVPLLGICVGMQILFDGSEEGDGPCLGLISGQSERLHHAPRLPHIGWNDVEGDHPLLEGAGGLFYFVHSYAPVPDDQSVSVGWTEYGSRFVSTVATGQIFGVQFHPERSGRGGLRLLSNFVAICSRVTHAT